MSQDPYEVLGVPSNATAKEIKSAYRDLVKRHHPDAGGDEEIILSINAAWEILGDTEQREAFDLSQKVNDYFIKKEENRSIRNNKANDLTNSIKIKVAKEENALTNWIKDVYNPIDKLLGQIINPYSEEIRELSADPYDENLMDSFCFYIKESQIKIKKIYHLYEVIKTPISAEGLSINLYRCFSQVKDALNELERYTMGYVDNYLHDGIEMMRVAKKMRIDLKKTRRNLPLS